MKNIFLILFIFIFHSTIADCQPLSIEKKFSPNISQEYIQQLSPKTKILGKFRAYGAGNIFLIPEDNQKVRIPITNYSEIPTTALGIPATVGIEKSDVGIRKKIVTLGISSKWDTYKKDLHPGKFQNLYKAMDTLGSTGGKVFNKGAMGAPKKRLSNEIVNVQSAFVDSYSKLKPDQKKERKAILGAYHEVLKTKKAIYIRDDRYIPEAYKEIYANSKGSVALFNSSGAYCSGVLIGKDIVLTANHCIEKWFPEDIDVVFSYEIDIKGNPIVPKDKYKAEKFIKFLPIDGAVQLDIALIRLEKNKANSNGVDKFVSAGENWPIQCLSEKRVLKDDPIYIIGHPQGDPRTVADNAFVKFPFKVGEKEFNQIKLSVETELKDDLNREEIMSAFFDSYQEHTIDGRKTFLNYSKRWYSQPTIGVDSDTFHGNSGSPAYHRITHKVIGLLIAGEQDLDDYIYAPGWRTHEAVFPASQIVTKIQEKLPNWRDEGICEP